MRVSDYIFQRLADWGVRHAFLITGGGAMHLNDALGRQKRIRYVCNLHEQACAIAAEGYARISGQPGVVCVTSGPGGTNALTGVAGAWLDSMPMLVLSGQVKTTTSIISCPELSLRQLGDQELNIIDLARPICKYAVMISDPATIRYHLEKAWYLCQHGRPGPVWLDIPLNVQATEFDEKLNTRTFNPAEYEIPLPQQTQINEVAKKLRHAKRPVILAGSGVRSAKAETEFLALAEKWEIPILTAISGIDLLPSNHRLFFGRPGILGERAANFILQNSDLLLILGTRMGLRICGYAYEQVAREAYKIMVDIDSAELQKPTLHIDLPIHSDAGAFLTALSKCLPSLPKNGNWLAYCQELRKAYPVILPQHRKRKDYVSSYVFPELLAKTAPADAIIVTGNGTAYTSTFQAIPLQSGMRMFANAGCAAMGYDLPAAIGAAFAGSPRPVLCLTGDGSIQMNLQELQTILNYHLPIKIFVYNNAGYLSIKLTQRAFFQGHYVGCTAESGIQLPQLEKIATAYGLPFCRLNNNLEAAASLPEILARPGPELVEVMTDPFEELGPKSASKMLPDGNMVSMPLEDLAPFLPRDEFRRRMLIKPMEESCQEPPA